MILVDYSQLTIAACLAFPEDFKKGADTEKMRAMVRHTTLNALLSIKQQYSPKYGEIVLCADGRNYWRKEHFPYYKGHRKAAREESTTDWKALFDFSREFSEDLQKVFPWKFIRVDRAEADDVIAVLTKFAATEMSETVGLIQEAPPVLIYSSDGDFKQLHKYRNVRQFNPIMKKMVAKPEPEFLFEKILKGDSGDGVPNVLSEDNFLMEGEGRAKAITAKVKERFKTGQTTQIEQRNFDRNKLLIDFDCIPGDVAGEVLNTFESSTPVRDLNGVMNYLMAHRMRLLLNRIQEFKV